MGAFIFHLPGRVFSPNKLAERERPLEGAPNPEQGKLVIYRFSAFFFFSSFFFVITPEIQTRTLEARGFSFFFPPHFVVVAAFSF